MMQTSIFDAEITGGRILVGDDIHFSRCYFFQVSFDFADDEQRLHSCVLDQCLMPADWNVNVHGSVVTGWSES
jgi:hypothetical protein